MGNDTNRKKLNKLLGKKIEYEALFLKEDNKRALLLNVTHKGKVYTDHAWVTMVKTLDNLEPKTKVRFTAIAYTYTDKHGIRKNGLSQCHKYYLSNDIIDKVKEDDHQRYLRNSR